MIKEEKLHENISFHEICLLAKVYRPKAINLLSEKLRISKADAVFKLNELEHLEN